MKYSNSSLEFIPPAALVVKLTTFSDFPSAMTTTSPGRAPTQLIKLLLH